MTALSDFHPFDPATLEDPWEFNRLLRAEAPVYHDPNTGIIFVSTYEAVGQVARDHETFSNRFGVAMGGGGGLPPEVREVAKQGWPAVDTMLTADPPEQRRFRKLVNKAFTANKVGRLDAKVHALADALVESFIADGRVELLSQFAQPLPLEMIAGQLGVSTEDLPRFRRWSDGFVDQLSGMADLEAQVDAAHRILEFQRYFAERLEERQKDPRDDILSDIVNARVEDERPLDMAESLSILQQILVAGNETTANAIAEGMLLLVTHPEELARVREDPGLVPNLVEEVLRLATPTHSMWRVATRDAEIAGTEIPKGAMMMIRYASANRDERVFPDPDRFDPTRSNAGEHVAFGVGAHFCLGAVLARKEMTVAFETLLPRLREPRLDPEHGAPRHRPNMLLRGLESLHLRFAA